MYGYKGCQKNSAVVYFGFSRLHSIAVDNRVTIPVVHVRVFNQLLCFIALQEPNPCYIQLIQSKLTDVSVRLVFVWIKTKYQ